MSPADDIDEIYGVVGGELTERFQLKPMYVE